MYAFIGLIGFFGIIAGIVMLMSARKKKKEKKPGGLVLLISFILFSIALALDPSIEEETGSDEKVETAAPVVNEEVKETAEEKEERIAKEAIEKAAIEATAKKEAEAKAKAEAEQKAKEEAEAKAKAEAEAQALADKKANAQSIDYAQLKKNPDRYSGEYVKYTGEIIQILEGDDMTNIRLSVTKESYGYSFNDLVFVEYIGYTDFVDGDIVTIYGEVYGAYSYESQAGFNISLPGIIADEVLPAQ